MVTSKMMVDVFSVPPFPFPSRPLPSPPSSVLSLPLPAYRLGGSLIRHRALDSSRRLAQTHAHHSRVQSVQCRTNLTLSHTGCRLISGKSCCFHLAISWTTDLCRSRRVPLRLAPVLLPLDHTRFAVIFGHLGVCLLS
jgi:hypothetical protein